MPLGPAAPEGRIGPPTSGDGEEGTLGGIVPHREGDTTTRFQHADHFADGPGGVGKEHQAARTGDRVKRPFVEPEMLGIHLYELNMVEPRLACSPLGARKHFRRNVDGRHASGGANTGSSRQGRLTGAVRHVEQPRPRLKGDGFTTPCEERLKGNGVPGPGARRRATIGSRLPHQPPCT